LGPPCPSTWEKSIVTCVCSISRRPTWPRSGSVPLNALSSWTLMPGSAASKIRRQHFFHLLHQAGLGLSVHRSGCRFTRSQGVSPTFVEHQPWCASEDSGVDPPFREGELTFSWALRVYAAD